MREKHRLSLWPIAVLPAYFADPRLVSLPPIIVGKLLGCRHQVSLSWQVTDGRRFDLEWDTVSNKERSSWGLWDIPARGLSLGHTWSISPPGEEAGEFSNTSYLFWQTATTSFHTFAIFSFSRLHCSWAPIENDLQMSLLFYAFAFFMLCFDYVL